MTATTQPPARAGRRTTPATYREPEPPSHLAPPPRRSFHPRQLLIPGLLVLGAGLLFGCRGGTRPVGNRNVPEPAKAVDLNPYLGRWYEVARYDHSFERDCAAATADYSVGSDGLIRIVNTCLQSGRDGRVRSITGKATIVPGSRNAKLKVSFFGPFFIGDYWILDHADDYGWSIVGEPSGRYLWLLSRDMAPDVVARSLLIERARQLGYDTTLLRMAHQPAA